MHRFFCQCTISCRRVWALYSGGVLCFDGLSVALQKPEIFVVVPKMRSFLSPPSTHTHTLQNILKVWKFSSQTGKMVHAFISNRLDYFTQWLSPLPLLVYIQYIRWLGLFSVICITHSPRYPGHAWMGTAPVWPWSW